MEGDNLVFSAYDVMHNLPGKYNIVKCRTCGLMRTNPRPTQDTIGFYYPDDYGPYIDSIIQVDTNDGQSINMKRIIKKLINKVYKVNSTIIPSLTPGRMLEIGCAGGLYLDYMAKKGWQVEGIEFSEKIAKQARNSGLKVYGGPLETAPEPNEPFDLIVGWMVLEHLHNPVIGLKSLYKWAKPGAWLVLSIPNADSLDFKMFKGKGYALQVPTHVHHYTPKSIEKVLKAGGWSIEKIYHQRTLSNIIGSIGYILRDKGFVRIGEIFIKFPGKGGRLNYILYPISLLLSFFGNTGRMTVWARKKR